MIASYTPATFTTENVKRNGRTVRVNIYRNGEYCCQLMPKEVRGWLIRMERAEADQVEWVAHCRKLQEERVAAYVAKRAARPVQLKFDF